MTRRFRLAAVTSHPVQYQAPLFQRLAQHPAIELTVYYGHDGSVIGEMDQEFGVPIAWDRPLLEGYRNVFLTERARRRGPLTETARQAAVVGHLRRGRYDAVFIHSYASRLSLAAYVGAWVSRTPVLLRTESHLMRRRPVATDAAKSLVLRSLFRHTAAFLFIGEANRRFYEQYGVAADHMFFTPYCVDNEYFVSERQKLTHERETIRREIGLASDRPVIVYSGKFIDRKRVDDLIRAVSLLSREQQPAELLIIGDGPCRASLIELAQALNVETKFVGFQNQTQLPRFYLCGDIFVLPSSYETWGLVLNEAMNFSMPVVTPTAVGAGLDLVCPGVTGYTYQAGDSAALAELLDELLNDADARRRMGDAAYGRIQAYNYHECVKGIVRALNYVVSGLPRESASEAR